MKTVGSTSTKIATSSFAYFTLFFNSLAKSKYFSVISFSFIFTLWFVERATFTRLD